MKLQATFIVFALLCSTSALADKSWCSVDEISHARSLSKNSYDQKAYEEALKTLTNLESNCILPTDVNHIWFANDKALVLMKMGKPKACLQELATVTNPLHYGEIWETSEGKSAVEAAYSNIDLCTQVLESKIGSFETLVCPCQNIPNDDSVTLAIQAPSGENGCVVKGSKTPSQTSDFDKGSFFFINEAGQKTSLNIKDGHLAEDYYCNIQKIAFQLNGDRHLLRFKGEGRECNGETAYMLIDVIYEWKGNQLILDQDNTIWFQ